MHRRVDVVLNGFGFLPIKQLVRTFLGILRGTYCQRRFGIKAGYFHRSSVPHYDDTLNTDEWQREVYAFAAEFMQTNQYQSVLDFGCGSGHKLIQYLGQFQTIGIELPETLTFLKVKYPTRTWLEAGEIDSHANKIDLIVCADVIEHVQDPEELLHQLQTLSDGADIIISTPARDLKRGRWHYGPPPNPYHVREWSQSELAAWLSSEFRIIYHTISNEVQGTQMILCRPLTSMAKHI